MDDQRSSLEGMGKHAAIVCGLRRSAIQRREQFRRSASSSPTCKGPVDTNEPSRASSQSRGQGRGKGGGELYGASSTLFRARLSALMTSDCQIKHETGIAKTHLDIGFVIAFRAHTFLSRSDEPQMPRQVRPLTLRDMLDPRCRGVKCAECAEDPNCHRVVTDCTSGYGTE